MEPATLTINEIFHSIQGESTWAGLPCAFVRLTGCNLRCTYCDTEYAFHEGDRMTIDTIITKVRQISGECRLVEVTGGEPLLQKNVHDLMNRLCDLGYTVLLETNGACDIAACDTLVIRIMDIKTPGSGECDKNHPPNIDRLTQRDEVKFIITDRADYEWAKNMVDKYDLVDRANAVLFSPVHESPAANLPPSDLARWIVDDNLPVRLQVQLHKLLWPDRTGGV